MFGLRQDCVSDNKGFSRNLWLGVIVLSLFVAGVAANAIHSSRLDHVELARTATQNLSLVLETEIADIFDQTDLALKNLADNYADNLRANRFPVDKWNAELQRQRSYLKILKGMRATDASGTVVFGLDSGDARNVSVADRDYFRTHRDNPDAGLVISQPVSSRVTHAWSLVLSRRLNDSHGKFSGIVAATIPLALLNERFARLKLGEQGSVGMRDGNLRLILRHPELPGGGAVGSTRIADEFKAALQQDNSLGSYHAGATSIDGIRRFHSYRRNDQFGFYINVGVADDEYLAAWQSDALLGGIILGIFMLITAGFALNMQRAWVQRQSLIDQLSKSESRFRNMFQNNDAVMLLIEPSSGDLVAANPAAARFYGYPIERLNEMRIDQINTLTPEEISKNRARAINHEQNMFVFPHRLASGEVRTVEVRSSPIVTEERNLLFSIIQDITERKRAEEDLRRSNAELEQFSYAISHDMRQPLRMISSYLQLLDRELAGQLDEEKRGFITFARDGAQRLDQMLVGLLEYARVGREGEPAQWVESRLLLDEALLYLEPAIAEAQADVRVLGDWPRINVSPNEILRLLQNLLGNAVKFHVANRQPEITVTSRITDAAWQVCVADNGVGMAADQIGRLFQVFQRLHSRADFEGTGIGLALCRKIVERHHGRIWAESAGNGQGSRFCFELPQRLIEP